VTIITFKLLVEETPIAGAPLIIDAQTQTTDTNGEVTTSLTVDNQHSITTGLEALTFDPILETGSELAQRNPVRIEGTRVVRSSQAPCRVLVGGDPNLFFPTFNSADHALSVPLEYQALNSMLSVTGGATPAEIFASGSSGFAVPESEFVTQDGLYGVWNFLGQSVLIPPSPEVCAGTGVPGECSVITDTELLRPFDYTRRAILRLAAEATRIARAKGVRTGGTSFSKAFLRRGAAVLATMQREIIRSKGDKFICEVAPMSCTTVRISQPKLTKAFGSIYDLKLPRNLEHLRKRKGREVGDFKKLLVGGTQEYIVCE